MLGKVWRNANGSRGIFGGAPARERHGGMGDAMRRAYGCIHRVRIYPALHRNDQILFRGRAGFRVNRSKRFVLDAEFD